MSTSPTSKKVNGAAVIVASNGRSEEDSPMAGTREDRLEKLLETIVDQNLKLPTMIAEHIAIRTASNGNGSKQIATWAGIVFVLVSSLISVGAIYNKLENALSVITDLKRDVAVERERVNELRLDVARGQSKIEELTKRGETRNARTDR